MCTRSHLTPKMLLNSAHASGTRNLGLKFFELLEGLRCLTPLVKAIRVRVHVSPTPWLYRTRIIYLLECRRSAPAASLIVHLVSKSIECMNHDTNSSAGGVGNDEYAFTVHKTSQTVTTECRGEGEKKTYVRFLEIAEGDVTVTINLDSLAQIVASKTLSSTSGKCRLLNGCVTAVAANVTRTRQDLYRAV